MREPVETPFVGGFRDGGTCFGDVPEGGAVWCLPFMTDRGFTSISRYIYNVERRAFVFDRIVTPEEAGMTRIPQ